jgi:hypothetical protein
MVATAAAMTTGPIAFRYPRGEGVGVEMPERGTPLEIGRGRMIREGKASRSSPSAPGCRGLKAGRGRAGGARHRPPSPTPASPSRSTAT